jgi:hypothetical protein
MTKLLQYQSNALKQFANPRIDGKFQEVINKPLNRYIAQLQKDRPESFQDATSKHLRVFFNEPRSNIPYLRAIHKVIK